MDALRTSLRNIFRKRLRSVLTIAGIAIGVLSVVIITSIGDIGKRTVNSELDSIGIGGIAISAENTSVGDAQLSLIESDEMVTDCMPVLAKYTTAEIHNTETKSMVFGINTQAKQMVSLEVLHGRMINQSDLQANARVCVVDESYAKATYKRSNIVGKTINVLLGETYQPLEVVGVVASGGNVLQNLMGEYIPCFIYAPYTTVQTAYGTTGYDQIMVKLKEGADSEQVSDALVTKLETSLSSGSVQVQNLVQQKEKLNGILDVVTLILAVIGGISLVVAGLSIMTVMLVSVHERTREIGIKKAIGASRGIILREFMAESFLICLIGGAAGLALGVGLTFAGCLLTGIAFVPNFGMMGFCLLFSLVVGMLFGVYPAMKASQLKPVDALRME